MNHWFCCVSFLAIVSPSFAQDSGRSESNLLGDWRGSSVCQVRESSCRDEASLYHVASIPEKPNWFSVKGDKIVEGRAITMGTVECHYDSARSDLTCDLPSGVLRFTVQGNKMEGTMALPDGTLWRKLNLTKVASRKTSG
jgi:hypothetical protein